MKASDYIIQYISDQGIDCVFGYIGGAITHLVDSTDKNKSVQFIQVYHEQSAAFAAEGYARHSGNVGVAMATSGPGATNLITGIADAFFDSIPVVFITGQVNTFEYKYEKPIRQQGFQETDIVSIVKPITKYSSIVSDSGQVVTELRKAFDIAREGRPGPVLLDIPMDIQRADIKPIQFLNNKTKNKQPSLKEFSVKLISLLKQSKRPIILAGGGVIKSRGEKELLEFAISNNIPVVVSLMGKGSFPEDNALFAGMIGSYGNRCANMVLSNSDLLLALGSRLDTRQVGTSLKSFLREGRIVHVDIDDKEIEHNRLQRHLKINYDVANLLMDLNKNKYKKKKQEEWMLYVEKIKKEYSQKIEVEKNCDNKIPYKVMERLNAASSDSQIYCVDIGQNQMFAAQALEIRENQKFYTSGGMAPMGYAIPVSVGSSFAERKNKSIIAIVGDGGFHMSTQSLMLISQFNLPIKIIVLNNNALGMITQFQDLYFDKREVATTKKGGYVVPDIKSMAASYKLKHYQVNESGLGDLGEIIRSKGPCLIEIVIEGKTTVCPKLEVNTPIEDLNPKLNRKELEDMMIIDLFDNK